MNNVLLQKLFYRNIYKKEKGLNTYKHLLATSRQQH